MNLRTATNADAEAIRELIFGVLVEYGLPPDPNGTDADLQDIEANYTRRGGLFQVIVKADGTIVGTVGLYPKEDQVVELRKMYLAPEIRGQGWGKRLMQQMLTEARQLGFRRMELETSSKLVEAIGLYQRFGFELLATDPHVPRCDKAFARDL